MYIMQYSANPFPVRNWEYQDGNSCARTDLWFRRNDDQETPQIIRRNPIPQQTQPRTNPPPQPRYTGIFQAMGKQQPLPSKLQDVPIMQGRSNIL